MISVCFQGKLFSIIEIQVYAPSSTAEEAEVEWFYENLQDLLELTPQKRCPFHYRGWECRCRKSRATRNNRQIWPWGTKQSRAKANSFAKRAHWSQPTAYFNNTRRLYTWTLPDGQYQNQIGYLAFQLKMENLYTVIKNKTRS